MHDRFKPSVTGHRSPRELAVLADEGLFADVHATPQRFVATVARHLRGWPGSTVIQWQIHSAIGELLGTSLAIAAMDAVMSLTKVSRVTAATRSKER
jgi:hypothetical protein